ncbi:glycosyltransferase family 25 protein [Pseudohalocynthiibacter aestuariivivens]|jgi:glycosyl transferase, family 25|uniref:Glycosyltransferase family 25 protein n=1 Tax=Pseudohalocynthiibacter aestuariivivens TaxID=1591409 RepID=A0ABV5JBU7_9RHOB|nr:MULTISPECIES: glycosyltransferase family 25 protein [Pseudohalocynthiibacter]MBS9718655.1 glycosyltransferase family 25 protein [Pseudohalocynthiibacter aestuariivivens]MCK0104131.1 glycosyltransferase family 25 protein [Pseudohalocynthiibacter sp. F2068]
MAAYKTFIVHLQRATGRKAQVQDLVSKAPYDAQIIDAVDGAKLPQTVLTNYYSGKTLFKPAYPFKLNVGEIGCFLSHRKVWNAIVEQNLDAGLIFEDDVQILPGQFGPAVAIAERNIEKLGYIQFQVRIVPDQNQVLAETLNAKIVQPIVTPLRTSAQFVSRAAAERLLNLTQKIDRPIDGFLQLHWETGVHLSCVVPSGVSDRTAETGGSTLSAKQPLIKKLARELKRNRYKTQIRKYSARSTDVIG